MKPTASSLLTAVRMFKKFHRRQVRALALIRVMWVSLLLSMIFIYVDVVAALSGNQRLLLDVVLLITLPSVAFLTCKWYARTTSRERMLARLIERGHSDFSNELVNAIDFDEKFKNQETKDISTSLMQEEIDLALGKLAQLEGLDSLKPRKLKKEKYLLVGLFFSGMFFLVLFHDWFSAVLPRYFDPFGDHPPYSPTKFIVEPAGATIDYGGNLIIKITATGKIPPNVNLALEDRFGNALNQVPMYNSEEGRFFQTVESVREEMIYYAKIPGGRSKRYVLSLSKTPRIESLKVAYQYPEYTNIKGDSRILVDPIIKGYRHSAVTLTVQSNRPLRKGELTVGDRSYVCRKQGENSVVTTFSLEQEGPFAVSITDIEGNRSATQLQGEIRIIPDDKPQIAIVSPGMDAFAVPTAKIPIVIQAQDDLGIRQINLFRSHNESGDFRKVLYRTEQAESFVDQTEILDLADLGLRPGDVIDYYASATDILPDPPQTIASRSYMLKIISAEEYARLMRQQMNAEELRKKYENILSQLDALLKTQEQLEKETRQLQQSLPQATPLTKEQNKQWEDLARRQEELAQKTNDLSNKLKEESQNPPVFDIEKDYKDILKDFSGRLQKAEQYMQAGSQRIKAARPPGDCQANLDQALQNQQKALQELGQKTQSMKQKIRQANENIEKIYNLMRDVEIFKILYQRQTALERHARFYKDVEKPDLEARIRLKEIAEEQHAIREQLNELKEMFREHSVLVQKDYPKVAADADAIADEIARRSIERHMAQASTYLDEGNGRQGHPHAKEALDQMREMISFCQGASGRGGKECEARLKITMNLNPGNTMNQLSQSLSPSSGMNMGPFGAMGRGSSGIAGGQANFAMFGNQTFASNLLKESNFAGAPSNNTRAQIRDSITDPLAGNIEELSTEKNSDLEISVEGPERMMAEYRRLIEAYFQRLAEEE